MSHELRGRRDLVRRAMSSLRVVLGAGGVLAAVGLAAATAQQVAQDRAARVARMSAEAEAKGLAEPFRGITTDGTEMPGLFPIASTGVSTEPVRTAAGAFLTTLTAEQRNRTTFPVDDPEWRKWMNQHFYVRQGVGFVDMSEAQREAAFGLLRASLSASGLQLTRDIMRLNHTLGELNNDNFDEYGEWLYWITVMGEPSATKPWGWQLDGHHLIINYFVLGDQVVMTPTFVGAEPVIATSGKYAGVTILQGEQDQGLALVNALTDAQKQAAILSSSKTGNNNLTEAWKDNVVLDYAGVKASAMTDAQRAQLLDLIGEYVGAMREGHAAVRMDEVRRHLPDTFFAWIGGTDPDSVSTTASTARSSSSSSIISRPWGCGTSRRIPGRPSVSTSTPLSARRTGTTTARIYSASTMRARPAMPRTVTARGSTLRCSDQAA